MGEWENGRVGEWEKEGQRSHSPILPFSHSWFYLPLTHSPILPFVSRSALALFLGLLILPYFVNLSAPSLWDTMEAFYAETPREMMELDSFVVPYFNYEPRLNKPPLSYWLVLPFYRVFSVSLVFERLVNALGAGLLILLTFALGSLLYNQRAGLLGAAIIETTPRLVLIAQKSIIDTYFTLFVTAALFFFWRIVEREKSRAAVILFYVALGLGVLTKGPLALVLPGGVIFFYLLLTKRWALFRRMNWPLGLLILAVMSLPWYVAIYLKLGWEPIATFIFRENVGRFTSDVDWSSRGPFYYVSVLLGDFFPWSLFLIPVGIFSYRTWRQKEEHQPVGLLFIWIAFVFIFFSLARNKHEYYLLPLYPAAAVLIGRLSVRLTDETISQTERRAVQMITLIIGAALVIGSVILSLFFKRVLQVPTWSYALPMVLFIGGLWLVVHARGQYLKRMPLVAVGVMLAAVIGHQLIYLPLSEPYRPTKPLCQLINTWVRPTDQVGYYKFAAPSMTFYLRRKIFDVYQRDAMLNLLRSDDRVFCIMQERDFHELEQALPGRLVILERRPMLSFRFNALVGSPRQGTLPHLLLISNRMP